MEHIETLELSSNVRIWNGTGTVLALPLLALGTGSASAMEHPNEWPEYPNPRISLEVEADAEGAIQTVNARTLLDQLEDIRTILQLPISEMAQLLHVSRQAIYKWLAGEVMPDSENAKRVYRLSEIAGQFNEAGVVRVGMLLKMKAFEGGRSLADLLQADECTDAHVEALIREAATMEDSYRRSGLSTSTAAASDDWKASISVPGGID